VFFYRAAISYITGAHSFKFGVGDIFGSTVERDWDINPVSYRLNNSVPNQITMRAYPLDFSSTSITSSAPTPRIGGRLTAHAQRGTEAGLVQEQLPGQTIGPAQLAPTRNFQFSDTEGLNLKDLSPKLSAAYDLTGNAKTALKVSLNRNVEPYTVGASPARIARLSGWRRRPHGVGDANGNYIPDCNLVVLTANGECDAVANRLFGSAGAQANFDPDVLRGGANVSTTGRCRRACSGKSRRACP